MKKYVLEFFRRGMTACGIGPIVLAILYLILQQQERIQTLTIDQVCLGIFSISALALDEIFLSISPFLPMMIPLWDSLSQ